MKDARRFLAMAGVDREDAVQSYAADKGGGRGMEGAFGQITIASPSPRQKARAQSPSPTSRQHKLAIKLLTQ